MILGHAHKLMQLPKIRNIAEQIGLHLNERSIRSTKDVRYKCPFCQASDHRKGKYYLSLNTERDVFQCWNCKESGGVIKFMSLLQGKSEAEILEELKGDRPTQKQRKLHPAEKLTPVQLKLLGIRGPSWHSLRNRNYQLYKRTLNWVWSEWQLYLIEQKRQAYIRFLIAETAKRKLAVCHECAQKLSLSATDLLFEFVTFKTSKKKPVWIISAERFISISGIKIS